LQKNFARLRPGPFREVCAVLHANSRSEDGFDITPRFRKTIEERIVRLEKDADWDESQIRLLAHQDHIRRQRRLVAAQRAEALRMRTFLDRARSREPWVVTSEQ
jgi:hypothetical protein